ncbi:unnamed protein product [Cyprideis torosa]|uniref:Uncharacterized protein n=1 Tax=Cyprideis torosa TaxID=163714 RepID=A0A7R8WRS9_9CRUS|nr:unnamed protein product [Cyprideis torosa]CAG0904494.1 unnamed protein product [Cyprideis torosa]
MVAMQGRVWILMLGLNTTEDVDVVCPQEVPDVVNAIVKAVGVQESDFQRVHAVCMRSPVSIIDVAICPRAILSESSSVALGGTERSSHREHWSLGYTVVQVQDEESVGGSPSNGSPGPVGQDAPMGGGSEGGVSQPREAPPKGTGVKKSIRRNNTANRVERDH